MGTEPSVLHGTRVRLEPLDHRHVEGLVAAAAVDPSLYQWSPVPQGQVEAAKYVETALAWRDAGTAVPFAIVRLDVGAVIGSTRFWNLERWAWPHGHPRHRRQVPDACEIGYTWLTRSAIRTAANTEAKLLMLTHAFEVLGCHRVEFKTDSLNEPARGALLGIGATFEGIFRNHMVMPEGRLRHSAYYSVIDDEWPAAKASLAATIDAAIARRGK